MIKQILVVDDDEHVLELLKYTLKREGYQILTATDGAKALELAEAVSPDLVLFDVMLPGMDGWDVLRILRSKTQTQHIPVIYLTAKGDEIDEAIGHELGANDYITKPFSLIKLKARIKNALRKTTGPAIENDAVIRIGEILIDPPCFGVKIANHKVSLTKREFEIFLYLARRPGKVVSRQNLLSRLWGHDGAVYERTVDVYIRNIREKLGREYANVIQTIVGVGYRFRKIE